VYVDGPPDRPATDRDLDVIRAVLEAAALGAGAVNPEETGHHLQILLIGGIVSANRGDLRAPERVHMMAKLVLELSR
jgi:hypothetical protein